MIKEELLSSDLTTSLFALSAAFMLLGGLFSLHAYWTYDKARELMETLTDLIWRICEQNETE